MGHLTDHLPTPEVCACVSFPMRMRLLMLQVFQIGKDLRGLERCWCAFQQDNKRHVQPGAAEFDQKSILPIVLLGDVITVSLPSFQPASDSCLVTK